MFKDRIKIIYNIYRRRNQVNDLRCNFGCITVEHLESSPSMSKNPTLEKTCITPLKFFLFRNEFIRAFFKSLEPIRKVMKPTFKGTKNIRISSVMNNPIGRPRSASSLNLKLNDPDKGQSLPKSFRHCVIIMY